VEAIGVKAVIDTKRKVLIGKDQAAFNNKTGIIYLKSKPKMYEALHESYHAEQWNELGEETYNKQSSLEKELYVYKQLMKNSSTLTEKQINHAKAYIEFVKTSYWPVRDTKTGLYIKLKR